MESILKPFMSQSNWEVSRRLTSEELRGQEKYPSSTRLVRSRKPVAFPQESFDLAGTSATEKKSVLGTKRGRW